MMPSRSAIHESAHAFIAHHFGGAVETCETFSGGGGGGRCKSTGLSRRRRLRVVLGGLVGVRIMCGDAHADPDLASGDIERAAEVAWALVTVGEPARLAKLGLDAPTEKMLARYGARAERLIAIAEADVRALLDANRHALLLLAAKLHTDGTLDDATVRAIIASATAGPG